MSRLFCLSLFQISGGVLGLPSLNKGLVLREEDEKT